MLFARPGIQNRLLSGEKLPFCGIIPKHLLIYLISREKSFENCHTTTGYVVKWGILTVIPELILLLGSVFLVIKGESVVAAVWQLRALFAVVAVVFVGLFEELTFRAMINDALLYSFRNNKHIFIWIAIISSLVFGSVHVISASIFTDSQALLLAVLKALSAGLGGFCWLILYWKTRNIWGIALIHGLCDFGTFLSGCAQVNINPSQTVVSSDAVRESHIYEIEEKTVPLYMGSPDQKMEVNLAFMDGAQENRTYILVAHNGIARICL